MKQLPEEGRAERMRALRELVSAYQRLAPEAHKADKIIQDLRDAGETESAMCSAIAGAIFDGLNYGNW